MDNQRLILFMVLTVILLLMWNAWEERTNPKLSVSTVQQENAISATDSTIDSPEIVESGSQQDVPSATSTADKPKISDTKIQSGKRVRVSTDVFDIEIDAVGGDIRRVQLPKYPVSLQEKDTPYPFMGDKLPQFYIAQSGLLSNQVAPDHHAVYEIEGDEFRLSEGQNELQVPLIWRSSDGNVQVRKTFTFKRGEYLINVDHEVINQTGEVWSGRLYRQIQRGEYDEVGKTRMLYTYTGAAVSTEETKFEKIQFDEMKDWRAEQSYTKGGWVGMLQHYFFSAWIAGVDELNHLYTRVLDDTRYIVGMTGQEKKVAANSSAMFKSSIYIGPKEQKRLEKIADSLKLTVDYGVLTFIAQPLFWLLGAIHSVIGNWGWAIIFVTLIIKLVFYKLSEASYRSMANMRKLAPKFQSIREKYGEDRQRMSQAMMELYKTEKVNPMSGCWPMLVQIPVFIALYWVLLESVELRQAPWILWIEDLATKDPFYILPLLMGASMFVQQKLSHNPGMDPMQQKIMQFLPIIFTFFFMLFPAGLVLYWVVNSILSILQQWYIMRKLDAAA